MQLKIDIIELTDFKGDMVQIVTRRALPPGTRIDFEAPVALDGRPLELSGKVTRIDKHSADAFAVSVRLQSMTRDGRAVLEAFSAERPKADKER